MNSLQIPDVIKIIWPLLLIQVAFQAYAIYDLFSVKSGRTRNLSSAMWGLILVLGGVVGFAAYFLIGRSEE